MRGRKPELASDPVRDYRPRLRGLPL